MTAIIFLSIFGFILGMINGGAYHDFKKKINDIKVLFFGFSFFSLVFFFMVWSVFYSIDESLNIHERVGVLIIPPSIWVFSFVDGYRGGNKIQKFMDYFKNSFGGIFKIFGSFLGVVLIIILVVIVIFLLVKLVKYFWYL